MAVILRSNTDLVYLPDHGFVGEEGALRILPQITRQIHRLDISHNLLGSAGTLTLFKGLSTLRLRHSSPELGLGIWGLKEINLGMNGLDDIALDCVLGYAKKDVYLKRVLVQGNEIKLDLKFVESIINSLNSSKINSLSLVNNTSIDQDGLNRFLDLLNSTELKQLNLSACNLDHKITDSIMKYLSSSRSRNLENLELNGNHLGSESITKIIDSIEESNFTITSIGLLANHALSDQLVAIDDDQPQQNDNGYNDPRLIDRTEENRSMEYQVHRRLPELLNRNKILTKRIKQATLKALVPCRIILNGLEPSNEYTAKRIINEISNGIFDHNKFRLMDLPEEVIHLILKHTSEDYLAFSDSQWLKLRKESINKENLMNMYNRRLNRLRGKGILYTKQERMEVENELRDGFLKRGKWDKWEMNGASSI
ncbi:uncharacterized protein L201_006466 [Kwoniella dendrophila CBS 6074]|uniref:F-box domain-containing protein n=1 Tax=Kwoniella dendrophila CBS 6074 TaxID=1295534 RepID=A0AAX4K434_9TREE